MKNRTTQLIFQTAYCTLGVLGIVASLGFFEYEFYPQFYVQFTNLSNYFCIGIMFAELIQTMKKDGDTYVSVLPGMKFTGILAIMLTFFVFNLLLAGEAGRDPAANYKVASILMHVILPVMYVADWFLFYEHGKVTWYMPLMSAMVPLVYVGFIFGRAWIHHFDTKVPLLYPYFFLNLEKQQVRGVVRWILVLLLAFIIAGYMFLGIDRMIGKYKRKKQCQ